MCITFWRVIFFFLLEQIAYNLTTFSLEESEGNISLFINGGVKKDERTMPVDTHVPNIFSLGGELRQNRLKRFSGEV